MTTFEAASVALQASPSTTFSPIQSLAELETFLRTADLPTRARQDMLAALTTLARAAGKPLSMLPAESKQLRHILNELSPVMAGVSGGRWRNVRSLLGRALELARAARVLRRHRNPRSPAWAALFELLPASGSERNRLSRLSGFCSQEGIEPAAVTDSVLDRFLEALLAAPLISKPFFLYGNAIKAWNNQRDKPGWPQARLIRQDRRNSYAVSPALLPASLTADIQAWLDRLAGADLTDGNDFRPLRPVTLSLRSKQVRALVSAMVQAGVDPASLRSLADVITPANVAKALEYIRARRGGVWTAQAEHFATVARSIACHHVEAAPEVVKRLTSMRRKVTPPRTGMSERCRVRLRELDDPHRLDALFGLPPILWDEVRHAGPPDIASARLLRGAVALEILTMAPIRLSNLQHLRLGESLLSGARGSLTIALASEHTKNRQPFEAVLPTQSARMINAYTSRYQPLLAEQRCAWLFPNKAGTGPMTDAQLRTQIVRLARMRAGVVLHPHLFRHIAAKVILDSDPGAYGRARLTLGHRSTRTTEIFYAGSDSRRAMELYGDEVLRLRSDRRVYKRQGPARGGRSR